MYIRSVFPLGAFFMTWLVACNVTATSHEKHATMLCMKNAANVGGAWLANWYLVIMMKNGTRASPLASQPEPPSTEVPQYFLILAL